MRALAIFGALTFFVACASASDLEIRAVRHRSDVGVANGESLASKLIALAESCSVNSTSYGASAANWAQTLASGSFVHVVFSNPRRARLISSNSQSRELQAIREILLPLPENAWPAHVFVRIDNGYIAFTKYDVGAMRAVILVRELELSTLEPYQLLLPLPTTQ